MVTKVLSFRELTQLLRVARGVFGVTFEYRGDEVVKWPYGGAEEDLTMKSKGASLRGSARIVKVIALLLERGMVMGRLNEPLLPSSAVFSSEQQTSLN
jgi:hypothetical protein